MPPWKYLLKEKEFETWYAEQRSAKLLAWKYLLKEKEFETRHPRHGNRPSMGVEIPAQRERI